MEFDPILAFGSTLVMLCLSAMGLMFWTIRTVSGLTAKVETNTARLDALDSRVEALAAEVAENRKQIRLLRTDMTEQFRQVGEGFRLLRAERAEQFRHVGEGFRLLRAENREDLGLLRAENRESLSEMGRRIDRLRDRIDANAAIHDANLKEVGKQVAAFNDRVSRVEGYIEAISGGEWPVASGQ